MRYKNNIGPQVRRRRYALDGRSQFLPRSCRSLVSTSAEAVFRRSRRAFHMSTTRRCSIWLRCSKWRCRSFFRRDQLEIEFTTSSRNLRRHDSNVAVFRLAFW